MKQEKELSPVWIKATVALIVMIVFAFLGVYQLMPPAVEAAGVSPDNFSAVEAFEYLEVIAKEPHPLGTPEKKKVRDYIVEQIKKLELEVIVQEGRVRKRNGPGEWRLENILTRVKGSQSTGAILVAAHYDSVPKAPGASDDGAAVAAMLTSLRALKALPQLKNDVIFLVSDGEEYGLLGAREFADNHPWHKDVAIVFNYEARGHKGPSLMFETNEQNGWVIAQFAKAAPHPRAYSWSYEVYKRMPNDSDFSIFRRRGLTGLNFAFIGGVKYYHTPMDNLENIDPRSLQHHGENMLPFLKHFGDLDLSDTKADNRVYFSIFNTLVHYSASLALPFMIMVGLAFLALLVWGVKAGHLKISHLPAGFILFFTVLLLSFLVLFLAGKASAGVEPDLYAGYYSLAFSFLSVGLFSFAYWLYFKRFTEQNLFAGALIWLFILMISSTIIAPGASYLFTWPLLFGSAALILRCKGKENDSWGQVIAQALLALPAFLILAPFVPLSIDALGVGFAYALANLFLALMVVLLIPFFRLILKAFKWLLPLVLFLVGFLMLLFGLFIH